MPYLLPKLNFRKSSVSDKLTDPGNIDQGGKRLSISTETRSSRSSTNTTMSPTTTAMPVVKSPDWEVRYDTTLCVYYFINTKTNETQFDHPDEVVSPLASPVLLCKSPDDEHRKVFSSSLKRSLSPKFFGSGLRRMSSVKQRTPRQSQELQAADVDDEDDIEEFKRQFDLEIQNYECERLNSDI